MTSSFTRVAATPQPGHTRAVGSVVTTCTTRIPSGSRWTCATATRRDRTTVSRVEHHPKRSLTVMIHQAGRHPSPTKIEDPLTHGFTRPRSKRRQRAASTDFHPSTGLPPGRQGLTRRVRRVARRHRADPTARSRRTVLPPRWPTPWRPARPARPRSARPDRGWVVIVPDGCTGADRPLTSTAAVITMNAQVITAKIDRPRWPNHVTAATAAVRARASGMRQAARAGT